MVNNKEKNVNTTKETTHSGMYVGWAALTKQKFTTPIQNKTNYNVYKYIQVLDLIYIRR